MTTEALLRRSILCCLILLLCPSIPLLGQVPKTFWGLTWNTASVPQPSIPYGYARIFGGINASWANLQVACVAPIATTPSNFNFTNMNSDIRRQITAGATEIEIEAGSYTPNCVNGVTVDTCTPGANPKGYCYVPTDLNSSGSAYFRAFLTALAADLNTNFPGFTGFYLSGWNEWNAGTGVYQPGTGATGIRYLGWMQQDLCNSAHANSWLCSTPNTAGMESNSSAVLLGNYVAEEISLYGHVISDTVNFHLYTNAPPGYNVPETAGTVEVAQAYAAIVAAGLASPVMRSSEGSWLSSLWTTWSTLVNYKTSTLVQSGSTCYVAIQNGAGHLPATSPTYWTATSCTDPDLSAAFLARYFLSIVNRTGMQAAMWFSYNLNDGQLYPPGGPVNEAGVTYQNLAMLATGMTFTSVPGCGVSGTVWTCPGTQSGVNVEWVWDTNNYCAGGTCTSTTFAVTAGAWTSYVDVTTGLVTSISPSATTVPVSVKPILLQASAAPTLGSISPASGYQGTSVPVTLTGTNFLSPATISISGAGVTASSVAVTSATSISAVFVISGGAAATARSVTVTTSGGTTGAVTFTVLSAVSPGTLGGRIVGVTQQWR